MPNPAAHPDEREALCYFLQRPWPRGGNKREVPWENVGSCGSGQLPGDRDWIVHCYEMAISYITFAIGGPPEGCELAIMWHEYELGDYPSVGVHLGFPHSDPPWQYTQKCELLLSKLDEAIDWHTLNPGEALADLDDNEYEGDID